MTLIFKAKKCLQEWGLKSNNLTGTLMIYRSKIFMLPSNSYKQSVGVMSDKHSY